MNKITQLVGLPAVWQGGMYMTFKCSFYVNADYAYVYIRIYRRPAGEGSWIYYSQNLKAYGRGMQYFERKNIYNWVGFGQMYFEVWSNPDPHVYSNIVDYWCGVPPVSYHFRAYGIAGDGEVYYGEDDIVHFI